MKHLSLLDYTKEDFQQMFQEIGMQKYLAVQIFDWVYRKFNYDISSWSNVSKKNREYLIENYQISLPEVVTKQLSTDGTEKYLLKLSDGNTIEAVVIKSESRLTLCVSTQVGCAIGCKFCHTGTQGFTRNLLPSEIVGQYLVANGLVNESSDEELKITNIVYMGMGEPLHNFENVKTASYILLEPQGLYIGQRRITLSTSGLVPQIEKLNEFPPVNIAISLHAAHDNIRDELMPINKRYNLSKLFNAIRKIPLKANRHITYEYLLIDGLNNREEDIDALVDLLAAKKSKVNIIPCNEYPNSSYKRPTDENITWFCNELNRRGLFTTIRSSKGDDILAACGQLKSSKDKK